jgi:hypothetical protein
MNGNHLLIFVSLFAGIMLQYIIMHNYLITGTGNWWINKAFLLLFPAMR